MSLINGKNLHVVFITLSNKLKSKNLFRFKYESLHNGCNFNHVENFMFSYRGNLTKIINF